MKFMCETKKLCDAVGKVSRAVSSKSNIPALEGILLEAGKDELILSGYDLELGIIIKLPARVSAPGKIVLNSKLFFDILVKLSGEGLIYESNDDLHAVIKSGNAEFNISGIDAVEYPDIPRILGVETLNIKADLLASMIDQTIFAISESDLKPIHTGTLFEIKKDMFRLVSVDGYRLAIRTEIMKNDEEKSFVVPGKTLTELSKFLSEEEGNVSIKLEKKHILFRTDGMTVVSRLLMGEFLDYEAAITGETTSTVKVNTRAWRESVTRVGLMVTERLKSPIRCVFEGDLAKLSCQTVIGKAMDETSIELKGEALTIGFNNKYMLDAVRASGCDMIKIEMSTSVAPIKITPLDSEEFLFLVLPVRLINE